MNSEHNKLSFGLIAQLVEHCTGSAEVIGSNPVQAKHILQVQFLQQSGCVDNCKNLSSM